jgi:hypothetical protein
MKALTLPSTAIVRLVYTRDETKTTQYGTLIQNPKTISEAYRVALFTKHIPAKNIVRFEAVAPMPRRRH